jgi:L-rhamnose isomerase
MGLARNKASNYWVDKGLEDVRNVEKAPELREWLALRNMWLPNSRKTSKGERSQERQSLENKRSKVTASKLNSKEERKTKRGSTKEIKFLCVNQAKTSWISIKPRSKRERRNQYDR